MSEVLIWPSRFKSPVGGNEPVALVKFSGESVPTVIAVCAAAYARFSESKPFVGSWPAEKVNEGVNAGKTNRIAVNVEEIVDRERGISFRQ